LITCLYIDEANNLLYIGDKESKKYIYHLSGNSLLNEFSRNESVFLDIKYLNNNLIVVTQDANGISFVDFVTNEVYAIVEGLNNWEDGTQFNYSENGEIVIYPDGNGGIVVHNLIENKEIANYTLQVEGKITSLAITNNADFIVIGTENDGVYEYTPATDKLVRSKQNRLIPTSNLSGELSYSKVHDIKIDEEKSKYHFIVVDMVFATADYEVVKTSVVDNSEIRTIPLQNGLLNLENYLGSEVISISNISGQEVTYSQVEHHKYRIYNTDKLLFLILRTETEIMTFKLIAE